MNLQTAKERTLLGYAGGNKELMDLLGVGSSQFYRILDPEDKADLRLSELPRVMRLTGDYSLLHSLAGLTGHVCVKLPKARKMGPAELAGLQRAAADLVLALTDFYASNGVSPGRETVIDLADAVIRQAAGQRRAALEFAQPALFGEGGER